MSKHHFIIETDGVIVSPADRYVSVSFTAYLNDVLRDIGLPAILEALDKDEILAAIGEDYVRTYFSLEQK
jgi:hypothetical protein